VSLTQCRKRNALVAYFDYAFQIESGRMVDDTACASGTRSTFSAKRGRRGGHDQDHAAADKRPCAVSAPILKSAKSKS
jgi:hypothetical protein